MNINGSNPISCHNDVSSIRTEGHRDWDSNGMAIETLFVISKVIKVLFITSLIFLFILLHSFLFFFQHFFIPHFLVVITLFNHHRNHPHLFAQLIIPQPHGPISTSSDTQCPLTAFLTTRGRSGNCCIHCRNERRMTQQIPMSDMSLWKIRHTDFFIPIGSEYQLLFLIPIGGDYTQAGEHGAGMSQQQSSSSGCGFRIRLGGGWHRKGIGIPR
mmetsp:Transcript_30864/g.55927  ORF Transcript_30864/g.55927 Transcript_30864/m.55927 type:complete len:214 (+) Transcript_30864:632-1273(+)